MFVGGDWLTIPSAPAKYDKFLRARASIFREISNMLQLTEHPNILRLHEVCTAETACLRCLNGAHSLCVFVFVFVFVLIGVFVFVFVFVLIAECLC